ncbi:MAG: acyl-CoA dehydrogenase family protein [Dethiobacter sp.]|jgi:alkylation response protein AidB-like acyl-CoA dehydrogenase|nr:acyl-CoA dehydrogenase family protein [Dethiobacter sp.]
MDFRFNEEQEMLRKAAREFAEEVLAPRAEEIEENDEIPTEIFKEMAERDFFAVTVPEEYGGLGLGHVARMIILEEISRVSAAVAMMLQVFHLGIHPLITFGSEEQKQKYLPDLAAGKILATVAITEATGGSDPTGIQTTARPDGDGYILNGRKVFITGAKVADIAVILAKMNDDPGVFSAFIAEKGMQGYRSGRTEVKMGLKGSDTGDIILEDCRIPKENLLGNPGAGLKISLNAVGEVGRAGMTGCAMGLITACIEASVSFAGQRVLGGKPISKLQGIQWKLAEMFADLEASRLMGYRAAALKDAGQPCDAEFATSKYFSCEAAVRVAKLACDIHGAYGYMKEYPVQRYLRDAHLMIPSAGTSDIMKLVMARTVMKRYAV